MKIATAETKARRARRQKKRVSTSSLMNKCPMVIETARELAIGIAKTATSGIMKKKKERILCVIGIAITRTSISQDAKMGIIPNDMHRKYVKKRFKKWVNSI